MDNKQSSPGLVDSYSPEALAEITDGCSGKLSWLHKKLFGREIACTYCCDEHDLAYYEGGTAQDRKLADIRLRLCVQTAGNFSGWRGPPRRVWRFCLAWVMYGAVRAFGSRYFNNTGQ